MLELNHVMSQGQGLDVQIFTGTTSADLAQWQTWRKPRGAKFHYFFGVGGGSSGGCGINSAGTSGGGAGGGSGAQTQVIIPTLFVPEVLYIACGNGGIGPVTTGAVGVAGSNTKIYIEPDTTSNANMCLLHAWGGLVTGTAATSTVGGVAGSVALASTIVQMPLAARGQFSFLAGQVGTAGGTNGTAGVAIVLPVTGLMVTGGSGGGGSNAGTQFAGGQITGMGLGGYFPTIPGGIAAAGATPAGAGVGGLIQKWWLMNYGGTGGGGASVTGGGIAGVGGPGAPGSGGGGGGGENTTVTTMARGGDGGPGFVVAISF